MATSNAVAVVLASRASKWNVVASLAADGPPLSSDLVRYAQGAWAARRSDWSGSARIQLGGVPFTIERIRSLVSSSGQMLGIVGSAPSEPDINSLDPRLDHVAIYSGDRVVRLEVAPCGPILRIPAGADQEVIRTPVEHFDSGASMGETPVDPPTDLVELTRNRLRLRSDPFLFHEVISEDENPGLDSRLAIQSRFKDAIVHVLTFGKRHFIVAWNNSLSDRLQRAFAFHARLDNLAAAVEAPIGLCSGRDGNIQLSIPRATPVGSEIARRSHR